MPTAFVVREWVPSFRFEFLERSQGQSPFGDSPLRTLGLTLSRHRDSPRSGTVPTLSPSASEARRGCPPQGDCPLKRPESLRAVTGTVPVRGQSLKNAWTHPE